MTRLPKKYDELRKQAEFGELPRCVTLVLWRCKGRDVTLYNADLNQLVLDSKSDEQLEFLREQLNDK